MILTNDKIAVENESGHMAESRIPLRSRQTSSLYTQGRREAERAPGQYFGPGPVCLKVRRGGGTHGLVG